MADTKISDLTELTDAPASGDVLPIVDISDTTMAVSGTNKKIAISTLIPVRAWVNWDGTSNSADVSGTYARSGTTVTVTLTDHGLLTGHYVYCDFTSGTATDGGFVVTVTNANEFTLTHGTSGTTSGNVTLKRCPFGQSLGVASVTDIGTGSHVVNFSKAFTDTNYGVFGLNCSTTSGNTTRWVTYNQTIGRTTLYCSFLVGSGFGVTDNTPNGALFLGF